MRLNNKYKIYQKVGSIPESFHQRLLKFKRPKWKKIQQMILQNIHSQRNIVNNFHVKVAFKTWEKIKTYYSDGLKNKNAIYNYFDNGIRIKHINESLIISQKAKVQESFLSCLVKPEFRIDILLARFGFFSTSFEARQYISSGNVLVNDKTVFGNFFLKKGDVVILSNLTKVDVDKNLKRFSSTKIIYSFAEVDYYCNAIVITKNLSDLHLQDLYLLSVNSFDLKKIKDFL